MPLPDALSRALDLASDTFPEEASRAHAVLPMLLEGRPGEETGEGTGDAGSVLAMDGFPVEIAFSSADLSSLRYTVDPGHTDLSALQGLWSRLGAPPLPDGAMIEARRLQEGTQRRFGGFVGVRHGHDGDRFKLYLEVPEAAAAAAEPFAERLVGRPKALPNRRQRIEMIGLDPAAGRIEVYSRIEEMTTPEVTALLWRADLTGRRADLIGLLSECYPFPIWRELPGSVFGFSYSVPTAGGPVAFTLYTYARTMFGGDGRIRAALLDQAERRGWDLGFYAALSAPLADHDDPTTTNHTMFGMTVVGDSPPTVTFGLTPPGGGR